MSQWIPILVRAEDYPEVAALVAGREADRADSDVLPPVRVDAGAGFEGVDPATQRLAAYPSWPVQALARLAASDAVTAQRWARAMDVCAEERDQIWLTTSEVAERSGMSINEWRDAPRKISRHLKAHYSDVPRDGNDLSWPLLASTMPGSAEVSWAMTPTTRERWRAIRRGVKA